MNRRISSAVMALLLVGLLPAGVLAATGPRFDVQPGGGTPGAIWQQQPKVAIRTGNNIVGSATGTIHLALTPGTGTPGAKLSCSAVDVTLTNGAAQFAGCSIDLAGTGYRLTATWSQGGSTDSSTFTIGTAAGTATKLVFKTQPGTSAATQPLAPQPIVAITDAAGNTVTTGADATRNVSLAIGANPGGGVLTCTGGLTKAAVAGVATFAGCAISKPGNGYTLVASASSLTSATSALFNVTASPALTLSTTATVVTWGSGIALTATFGQLGANRQVQVQGSKNKTTWTVIANLLTNAAGTASLTYRPATNLYYRAVFAGAADLGALTSPTIRTVVRQISILRPTNFGAIKRISRGTAITFVDTVRPSRPELVPATVRFVFYKRASTGAWVVAGQRDVVVNAVGQASTRWTFTVGEWYVRSQARPTPDNANSVWGPIERYSVR